MRLALLATLLLFVAAQSPHLLVEVSFNPPSIDRYESLAAHEQRSGQGDWIVATLTEDNIIAQTRVTATQVDLWGEEEPLATTQVLVPTSPRATHIQLINPQGQVVATRSVSAVCGDGFCTPGEERTCPEDCQTEVEESFLLEEYHERIEAEPGMSSVRLYGIIGAALLIVILLAVLVMINRKKQPPQQPEQEFRH